MNSFSEKKYKQKERKNGCYLRIGQGFTLQELRNLVVKIPIGTRGHQIRAAHFQYDFLRTLVWLIIERNTTSNCFFLELNRNKYLKGVKQKKTKTKKVRSLQLIFVCFFLFFPFILFISGVFRFQNQGGMCLKSNDTVWKITIHS